MPRAHLVLKHMHKLAVLTLLALLAAGPTPTHTSTSHECIPFTKKHTTRNSQLFHNRPPGRAPLYEDPQPHNGSHIAGDPQAVRCAPESLSKRPLCKKLKFSTPADGHVFIDPATGHYFYEPDACTLRRLPSAEARACLARVGPILFIGDSVTRYQFLTLAHFLAAGSYQHPFDGPDSLSNANSQQDPTLPGGKFDKLWYNAVQQVRAHDPSGGQLHVNHSRAKHWEQAHLQLNTTTATTTSGDSVTAGASAKGQPLQKRDQLNVYYYNLNTAGPKAVHRALDWALAQRRDYSHVILNACAHYHGAAAAAGAGGGGEAAAAKPDPPPAAAEPAADWAATLVSDVTKSLAAAAQRLPRSVQLVWKSCTTPIEDYRQGTDRAEAEIADYCGRAGVAVYDIRAISMAAADQRLVATWRAGSVHFLQFMYEQFNDLLLNILCR